MATNGTQTLRIIDKEVEFWKAEEDEVRRKLRICFPKDEPEIIQALTQVRAIKTSVENYRKMIDSEVGSILHKYSEP